MPRQIIVDIVGDSKKYSQATNDAIKATVTMQSRMDKIKSSVVQGFGLGAGVSIFGLVSKGFGMVTDFMGDASKAASDLNETQSKLDQVFKTSAGTVRAWAENSAKSMGLSKQAALEAAGTFGNFLEAMGQAEPVASKMSTTMVQLAGDLASFNNADPSDVLEALRSGLSGETEPLRRFGVDISDAAVQSELLREGIQKVGGQFTQAQKIQGRYNLIMKQTVTAQGDFARTATGTANAQRTLNATIENAKAKVGQALNDLTGKLTVLASQVLPSFVDAFSWVTQGYKDQPEYVQKATDYINSYTLKVKDATQATIDLKTAQQDVIDPLKAYTDEYQNFLDVNRDFINQQDMTGQVYQWLDGLSRKLAMSTGQQADAFLNLAVRVQSAGGTLDDFLLAVQGLSATQVDIKGIAEHYHRSFTAIGKSATDAGNTIAGPAGPAAKTKMTVREMHKTLADASAPWKAEWKKLAEWAKNPFKPSSFENWIGARIKEARKKALDTSLDEATRRRWAKIARLMKNPVIQAGLAIGLTVDQALADIALVRGTGQTVADIITGAFDRIGSPHRDRNRNRNRNRNRGNNNRPPTGPSTGTSFLPAVPMAMGGPAAGGNIYNIAISVAPGGDLVDAGRQMVRAIQQYERRSGKVWRSA